MPLSRARLRSGGARRRRGLTLASPADRRSAPHGARGAWQIAETGTTPWAARFSTCARSQEIVR